MFIAIVDVCTSAHHRETALAQLLDEQILLRAMPGCIDFRVLVPPHDAARLTIIHEWQDEASFTAYTSSVEFTRSGEVIRPLLVEAPLSRRFRAELVESVN